MNIRIWRKPQTQRVGHGLLECAEIIFSGIGADVKCRIASVPRNGLLAGCKAADGGDDTVVLS